MLNFILSTIALYLAAFALNRHCDAQEISSITAASDPYESFNR
jgi:ABC-type transporter lipoprotein component MlaA